MNPYRARFERTQGGAALVDDVVVIDHWTSPPVPEWHVNREEQATGRVSTSPYATRLATIVFRDGTMDDVPITALRCTEPAYLAGGHEDEAPTHDHVMSPARPVLEGSRVIGTVRSCTVEGCGHQETTPTRSRSES